MFTAIRKRPPRQHFGNSNRKIFNKKINFRYNLRIYFDILKRYKVLFIILLAAILLIEATAVVDKFLFKIIIDEGTKFAQKSLPVEELLRTLITLAVIFLSVALLRALLKWIHIHYLNILEGNQIADLKRKFFNHLLQLSYQFHTTHKTGSLISRLVRGGRSMETMTDIIMFNVAPLVFQLVVVGGALLYFDWVPALVVLITAIIFIIYSYFLQRAQQKYTIAANDAEDFEKANIGDFFTNIDSIKYFGQEQKIAGRFFSISERTKAAIMAHWHFYRWLDAGQVLIISLGTFLVVYFPLRHFLEGTMTLGTLVFIYTVYGNLLVPLFGFVRGMRDFYRVMADFESLFQYGKISNEIKDKNEALESPLTEGTIEFRNITFSYVRGKIKRRLFFNFSLLVPKNKKVALVGHSGSGKTTLVKLLYRLYDVEKGTILIDGRDLRDFKQEFLRSELSIVPQECVLFDDTIYNNIAFSAPAASRQEVRQAMKFAQLDKVVRNFPQQENTIVGERGVRLSGGEKQRVSIARALLANKKILVLDEATSSLDSKTEQEIQRALQKLMQNRTTIIIAHRLSTIMKADKIVVMAKGKIVQTGTHTQLIRQRGVYRQLWNLQRGGYI